MTRFAGTGDQQTAGFDIAANAIQWRVTATCDGGALRVSLPPESDPLADPACPGKEFGFSIRAGPSVLDVAATGAWQVVVDQQLDTPIAEPVLAGMGEDALLARGSFYGVDQAGAGTASLYRMPDGKRALRLDPFEVTNNTDLFVWLSEDPEPTTSKAAISSGYVQIGELKSTVGSQNYVVPDDLPTDKIKSVIIWCEPVRTAYAAASLRD